MARIIENPSGKRNILLTTDDILTLVREYQKITAGARDYRDIRQKLSKNRLFLPEEII